VLCTICNHAEREEIERQFLNWANTVRIGMAHNVSRDAIYRHAHALALFPKRGRNLRSALEQIIEKAGDVEANVAGVVSAVSAYARINARGEWVERSEVVDLNALFDRMDRVELETYARSGTLPTWFPVVSGATATNGQGGNDER
jgi:hypothetical protein